MSMASEITRLQNDKTAIINTLTAQGVTVPADASFDDVATLIASISGGDTFEGLQLVSTDQTTIRPTAYKWKGDTIPSYGLYYYYFGAGNDQRCTIDLSDVEYVNQYGLGNSGLEPINASNIKEMDSYALALRQGITANDLRSKILNLESYTGYGIGRGTNINSVFRSNESTNYFGTILCPKIEHVPQFAFYAIKVDMNVQLGSIGYPVRSVGQKPFGGSMTGTNTITVYTTGELLNTLKTAIEDAAGINTTFIYKASEATTYNGTSYAAGDTILTI